MQTQLKERKHFFKSEKFWLVLGLSTTVFLAIYRLDSFPRFNFDEGYYLLFAKNLIEKGVYALSSTPDISDWFGHGNSSPTIVLPIALSFKLFSTNILAGRIVSSIYLIGAVAALYSLIRYLYGWQTAFVSATIFLFVGPLNEYNTVMLGRRILGEIPAFFFIFAGLRCWYQAWESNDSMRAILAGSLFGLAFITKVQFMPLVILAGGLVWLANHFYYRKLKIRMFIIPLLISGIPLGIWYSYKLMELGPDAFFNHLNTLSAVSRASTWLFAPSLWPENIGFLYKNAFLFLGLPSILYAFALSTRRSLSGVQSLFLPMFTSLLILWYVFISIGWWRYGYSGLILANLLAAKPIWDAFSGLTIKPTRLWTRLQQGEMIPQLIVIIVAFLVIAYPLQNTLRQIFSETDRTPQEFSQFVQNHTKPDDLIESYVWEITVLTPRNFHHPPTEVFVQALKNELDGTYDPLAFQPKYVVDGPYSKSVTLYPPEWLDACCQKIGSVGHYDLYSVSEINRP